MNTLRDKAKSVFLDALEIPSVEQRQAYLDTQCRGNTALRREVEELLWHYGKMGSFMETDSDGVAGKLRQALPAMQAALAGSVQGAVDACPGRAEAKAALSGVLGDFEIVREISRGGMGAVYEVIDRRQGIELALKELYDPTTAAVLRLKREFRSLADLGHRNLVVLDRLFCIEGRWFFTMELIRGRNFIEYVRIPSGPEEAGGQRQPACCRAGVSYARLRRALEQIALGLGALHQAGMLHRDVKPSNVLVSNEGRVVLVDFGLVAELTEANPGQVGGGTWGGTKPYMSPEQMAAEPLTYASDWYSVGVMLYESLTDRLPFEGSAASVLSQKRAGPPPGLPDEVPTEHHDLASLCIDLLHPDPSKRPTGSEILRRLRRGAGEEEAADREDAQDGRTVFVGRQRELAELHRALDDVRAGSCLRVYLAGEPGMGKTALVQRFLSAASASADVLVLQGRCYEREAIPYKALDSLVDAIVRHLNTLPAAEVDQFLPEDLCSLVRVFPALLHVRRIAAVASRGILPVDDRESRTRAIASFRELLQRLAQRTLTILVVDDLQWGDLDSAAFLSELLAPPEPPRLLFLACCRSDDRRQSECLHALLPEGEDPDISQREILVDELTREEVRELAVALLGSGDPLAEDLVALSPQIGGSPYLISEFAHRAKREGGPMLAAGGGPADLVSMLAHRIEQLPAMARQLLTVVAVSGHPIRLDLACEVAGLGLAPEVAVAVLRSENLLRTLADAAHQVAVYHDCIGEAATAGLPLEDRKRLHLQIAAMLENAADTDTAQLVRHYERAGDYDKAGRWALVAAEKAASALAFDQAATMYRAALASGNPNVEQQRSLRRKLADALSHAGRSGDAAAEYARLAECEEPAIRTELQRLAAMHYLISGHVDTGRVWLDRVLEDAGIPIPRSRWRTLAALLIDRARLRWRGLDLRPPRKRCSAIDQARLEAYWCAIIGLSMIDPFRAAYYSARNTLGSLRCGDPAVAGRALAMEAFHSALDGPMAGRRTGDLLDRAAMLDERAGDPYMRAFLALARAGAAFLEGDWAAALAHGRDSERSFRDHCRSVFWELSTAQVFQLYCLCYLGRFHELARGVREVLDEAVERGDLYTQLLLGTFPQPYLQLVADQPERAVCEVNALMARWSSGGLYVEHISMLFSQAHLAMYQGFGGRALEAMAEARAALARSLQWRMQHWRVMFKESHASAMVIAARTASDPRLLLKAAAKLGRSLERENHPCAAAFAPLVQAPLAFAEGRHDEAADFLRGALAGFERTGMALYAAVTRRRLGQLLGGQTGRDMVDQAETWMRSEGVKNISRMTDLFCPWIEETDHD